jgi:hypothetical protein
MLDSSADGAMRLPDLNPYPPETRQPSYPPADGRIVSISTVISIAFISVSLKCQMASNHLKNLFCLDDERSVLIKSTAYPSACLFST